MNASRRHCDISSNSSDQDDNVDVSFFDPYTDESVPKEESIDPFRFYSINEPEKKSVVGNRLDLMEREWQELEQMRFTEEKSGYESLISTRCLPAEKKDFIENPFYFSDRSNSFENNGYGDHYLYGIYAGWPHVMMFDKPGQYPNKDDFLSVSVERNLSHKNSLLSSASVTQIVGRISKDSLKTSTLSLLRPKDPQIRKNFLERQRAFLTEKKDHNKEALQPYVANINFPKRFPIEMNDTDPFPEFLKKFEYKQYRKRLLVASDVKPIAVVPSKIHLNKELEKVFPGKRRVKEESECWDSETQNQKELLLQEEVEKVMCKENKLKITSLKDLKKNFISTKKIPLKNYQDLVFQQEPAIRQNLKAFYDPQPKVETPWLNKMINSRRFTRKYYLRNFVRTKHKVRH